MKRTLLLGLLAFGTLFTTQAQNVLLVNDNDNITYNTDTLLNDLLAAGLNVTVWSIPDSGGMLPDLAAMTGYDQVIWYASTDGVDLGFHPSLQGVGFQGARYRLLRARRAELMATPFTLGVGFDGDQWEFFKYPAEDLLALYGRDHHTGITATAGGFYGPQGRNVRALAGVPDLNERLAEFEHEGLRVTNFEMETSALYGLSGILGHAACTVCTVVANRAEGTFLEDHHAAVEAMIDEVLDRSTI